MSEKKLALVTGASRGIGAATAKYLAENGYQVVGTATSESGAEKIQAQLKAIDAANAGIVLNIADAEQTQTALAGLLSEYGAPYLVVNNLASLEITYLCVYRMMIGRMWSIPI